MKKNILPASFIALILLSGCQQSLNQSPIVNQQKPSMVSPTNDQPTQEQTAPPTQQTSSVLTAMQELPDFGLFLSKPTNSAYAPMTTSQIKYYDDGIVDSGKYAGYHRIVAFGIAQEEGPDSNPLGGFLFLTKDDKTFIADSSNYADGDNNTPNNTVFDLSKVVGGDSVPLNHLASFTAGGVTYTLSNNSLPSLPTGVTELTPSIHPGLRFYSSQPENSLVPTDTTGLKPADTDNLKLEQKYVSYDASVYIADQNGLVYQYDMTAPDISKAKIINNTPLYSSYTNLFIAGCGYGDTFILKGVTDQDLKPAANNNGFTLYTLSDPQNPINKAEYYDKITQYVTNVPSKTNTSAFSFSDINPDPAKIKTPPTFDQYVAKNPVLVFKDAWGRYVGIGEGYYYLPGGCGKPVIYLYPQKPTDVTVKLDKPTTFTTDIPTYNGQWNVLANPDGILTDLQPQATDCRAIDSSKFGAEYAADACMTGKYPYLYWSGNTASEHPKTDTGWVVAKADLQNFLNEKMGDMGYTQKETADMTSYWVPEMLGKNVPYYRISFLQTAQMNSFIPLDVTPRPQTWLRMFMDWSPLTEKPISPLTPETLVHVVRQGFTLAEWGGLKQ